MRNWIEHWMRLTREFLRKSKGADNTKGNLSKEYLTIKYTFQSIPISIKRECAEILGENSPLVSSIFSCFKHHCPDDAKPNPTYHPILTERQTNARVLQPSLCLFHDGQFVLSLSALQKRQKSGYAARNNLF